MTIVKLPDPPVISGVDKLNTVSLLWKLQVKADAVGGTHIIGPSTIVPVPFAEKVITLSLMQASTWDDTSKPLAVAFSNLQFELVIISVLVAGVSSLLQLPDIRTTNKRLESAIEKRLFMEKRVFIDKVLFRNLLKVSEDWILFHFSLKALLKITCRQAIC